MNKEEGRGGWEEWRVHGKKFKKLIFPQWAPLLFVNSVCVEILVKKWIVQTFSNFHLKFKTVNLINAKSFDLQFYRFFEVLIKWRQKLFINQTVNWKYKHLVFPLDCQYHQGNPETLSHEVSQGLHQFLSILTKKNIEWLMWNINNNITCSDVTMWHSDNVPMCRCDDVSTSFITHLI